MRLTRRAKYDEPFTHQLRRCSFHTRQCTGFQRDPKTRGRTRALFGALVLMELVVDGKSWTGVAVVVDRTSGPSGLVALASIPEFRR
jgi:hypothetical protein